MKHVVVLAVQQFSFTVLVGPKVLRFFPVVNEKAVSLFLGHLSAFL